MNYNYVVLTQGEEFVDYSGFYTEAEVFAFCSDEPGKHTVFKKVVNDIPADDVGFKDE